MVIFLNYKLKPEVTEYCKGIVDPQSQARSDIAYTLRVFFFKNIVVINYNCFFKLEIVN